MSIDSEFLSTVSTSSGNRAPPPPFTQSQRKRPALSNLGIDVSLASDVKTPNTPTPNFTNEQMNSDTVLHVRQTPTPNPQIMPNIQGSHSSHPVQQYYSANNNASDEEVHEPQLLIVLEALSDFQRLFDQKSQTIKLLAKNLASQLQYRENELQTAASEKISNLKLLEIHKSELIILTDKLKEFGRYESLIKSKFETLENLMSEMITTKAQFLIKETDLKNDLDEREKRLNEAFILIQELRIEKESLETQTLTLENEKTERYSEFNSRLYNLNNEIKEKNRRIDLLSGENEVILSDLKNISADRDKIQKECSIALKNITELAVNESFTCNSNDLGSLERSVAWIKSQCVELKNSKVNFDLEEIVLRQTIQELEKQISMQTTEVNNKINENSLEFEKLKFLLETKEEKLRITDIELEEHKTELEIVDQFKEKAKNFGFSDDFEFYDKIIEKICKSKSSDQKIEDLNSEISQIKKEHSIELSNQKEEFGNLLREETSKWKIQREDLENEILKLKKIQQQQYQQQQLSQSQIKTLSQQSQNHDSDLTAIIKDLKESSELLNSGSKNTNGAAISKTSSKRTGSNSQIQKMKMLTNNSTNYSNKRRQVTSNGNNQKLGSPNSVNSNDIWSLFK